MELKQIFNSWAGSVGSEYARKQWLLSKWELFEGIDWPQEKNELMIRSIVQGLRLKTDHRLIDLGCGGGWILNQLKTSCGKIYGLDISFQMLKIAMMGCPKEKFLCGEIGKLPVRSNSFDRVLSFYVFLNFSHDAYVEQSLSEIVRILKRGGRALIGQLPDERRSQDYDKAKAGHLDYCRNHYTLGKNIRDIHTPPLRLFDKEKLGRFLKAHDVAHQFLKSFNPFYRSGQPQLIDWRFDLVLEKN